MILCEPPCIRQGSQTDRLGCMSAISATRLPGRFSLGPPSFPRSHLPIAPLQCWPVGQGIFFLHSPYLASCVGLPSPWIKSTHCSITVTTMPDGSANQVCVPCAWARKGACDSVRLNCQGWQWALSVFLNYYLPWELLSFCGWIG